MYLCNHVQILGCCALSVHCVALNEVDIVKDILSTCVFHGPALVDESYCQLIKQTTENTNTRHALRCWQLLYAFSVTVMPSNRFLINAILNYIQDSAHDMSLPSQCRELAEYCHLRLVNTLLYGVRGYLPSKAELSLALAMPSDKTCFSCTLDELMYVQHTFKPCLGLVYPEGLHTIVSAFDEHSSAFSTPNIFQQEPDPEALSIAIEDFCAGNFRSDDKMIPTCLPVCRKFHL